MSDNKIIHAFPDLPENLMTVAPRGAEVPYFCQHEAIRLNAHERTVHCARCGAALDPFDFLLNETTTIGRAWERHREAHRKVDELNERITALTKEEKRLRAAVRRLQDKAQEVVVVRGKML